MAQYSLILGLKPNLSSENREKAVGRVKKIIADNGGKVGKIKSSGLTKLAYPVSGFTEANFLVMFVDMEGEKVEMLQKEFRVVEGILRVMVIREEVKK